MSAVRGVDGRLQESTDLLAHADELLSGLGHHRVRAGVLLRHIELDIACGRLGGALYRAEHLVELIRRQALPERLPRAYALLATVLLALGDREEACDAASQARVYVSATEGSAWGARLRIARVFADLGRSSEALEVLPGTDELPNSLLHAPANQRAAILARCLAASDPARATDQAAWALVQTPARFPITAAAVARDIAAALLGAGQPAAARRAVKRGLKALQNSDADGLRLELLLMLHRAAPDDRVVEALQPVLSRIRRGLQGPRRQAFDARDDLAFLV